MHSSRARQLEKHQAREEPMDKSEEDERDNYYELEGRTLSRKMLRNHFLGTNL